MSWLSDASANRIIQSYTKNFVDVSGNFKVRNEVTTTSGGGSSTVDTTGASWSQLGSDIDGTSANDYFGYGTDLNSDGTILAAGAYNHNSGRGEVKVYEWNGSSWTQLGGTLDGEASGDAFGIGVALNDDGTILAVGAQLNDGGGGNSGHVRVYEYNGSSWIEETGAISSGINIIQMLDNNIGYAVTGNGTILKR